MEINKLNHQKITVALIIILSLFFFSNILRAQSSSRLGLLLTQKNPNCFTIQLCLQRIEKQALLGSPHAQYQLGQYYQYGKFVKKNKIKAYAYYRLAAMHYTKSQEAVTSLMREMTSSQLKAGNFLYRKLTNKIINNISEIHTILKQQQLSSKGAGE